MARTDLFAAKAEFATSLGGVPVVVHTGDLVREGHALLNGRRGLFEPYEPKIRFDVTRADGGPVLPAQEVVVGDRGPETVIPVKRRRKAAA